MAHVAIPPIGVHKQAIVLVDHSDGAGNRAMLARMRVRGTSWMGDAKNTTPSYNTRGGTLAGRSDRGQRFVQSPSLGRFGDLRHATEIFYGVDWRFLVAGVG